MSWGNYPYHHDTSQCTIVHFGNERVAEDYCTVCHDSFWCAGVTQAIAEGEPKDWLKALALCPHPHVDVCERDARDPSKQVPPGHEWPLTECVTEHYEVPGEERTGEFWHDTAIVYHRCQGCGRTGECDSVRFPDRECDLVRSGS